MNRELNFGFWRLVGGLEEFRLHGAAADAQAKQDELDALENARRLRLLTQMLKRMQNVLLHRAIRAMVAHLAEDKAAAALAALGDQNSEQLDALENERRLRILAAILKRMQNMLLNWAIRAMVAQWTVDKVDAKSKMEKGIWKQQQQFVAAAGDSKLNHLKLQARVRALAFMIHNMARREMTRWLGMLQRQFYRALAAKGGCPMHRERQRGSTRSPTKANSFCAGHERCATADSAIALVLLWHCAHSPLVLHSLGSHISLTLLQFCTHSTLSLLRRCSEILLPLPAICTYVIVFTGSVLVRRAEEVLTQSDTVRILASVVSAELCWR